MDNPFAWPRRAAGRRFGRIAVWLAASVVCIGPGQAQTSTGSLNGTLTDLHSHPLPGVTLQLRNAATGSITATVTRNGGTYRVQGLAPGEYEVKAASPSLGEGSVAGIRVWSGHESRVQTAIAFHAAMADAEARPPAIGMGELPAAAARAILPERSQPAALRAAAVPAFPPSASIGQAIRAAVGAEPATSSAFRRAAAGRDGLAALAAVAVAQTAAWKPRQPVPIPEAAAPTVNQTIAGEEMEALPLSGGRWQSFLADARGGQTDDSDFNNDRADGDDPAVRMDGSSAGLTFRHSQSQGLMPPGSAIGEFREAAVIEPNASADSGGVVLRSREGGLTLHGQAFLFNRHSAFGARNPFTQWVKMSAPGSTAATPAFTAYPYSPGDGQTRWGWGSGGATRRGRVFWFSAVDGEHRNHPAVSSVKHPENFFAQPTNDEMQVLSARLNQPGTNPIAEGVQAYSTVLESLAGLLGPAPRVSDQWAAFARLDWKAGERHQFSLNSSSATWNSPGGGLGRASETYGSHSFGMSRARHVSILGSWQAFLTPNLLAVTQVSLRHAEVSRGAEAASPFEQSLKASVWGQLPQMTVDSRYGFTIGTPARFGPGSAPDEHVYEARETLSWVRGPLLVKAGAELAHNADATRMLSNHAATYVYARAENFASDALAFAKFGLADALDANNQHNCDQRGKAWRDTTGQLHGLGNLPCYSYYTQTLGPTDWHLSTNQWAGFTSAQWQPAKAFVMTAGLRWDWEELPPPIALVSNPSLPLTQSLPHVGAAWNPRLALAWGGSERFRPVLRFGYGMYAGRTGNSVLETALTQTGSLKGDLKLFLRPTDDLPRNGGGAPPFPYALAGLPAQAVKPGVVEFAPNFRNAQIHQATAELETTLPGRILISVAAVASLARALPVSMDTNFDAGTNPRTITYAVVDASHKGPLRSAQVTAPFFASSGGASGRLNVNYQQITELMSRANSTYEAAVVQVARAVRNGLGFRARYTYGHAVDWNPNEGGRVMGSSVFDPTDFRLEYGTSNLDVRHSASIMVIWQAPWRRAGAEGRIANGWLLSATGQFHSGLPYTMRTAGSIPEEFLTTGDTLVGLGPGMNGYGGDSRVYGVGRNTFRYPPTWKADLRMGRRFALRHGREMELLAESFNLFNHQNVTQLETVGYTIEPGSTAGTLPTLNFLTGLKTGQTEFGRPLNINAVDSYRERQFDFGMRMRF